MDSGIMQNGNNLLCNYGGGKEFVNVAFQDETFWLTQKAMAELFDCTTDHAEYISELDRQTAKYPKGE